MYLIHLCRHSCFCYTEVLEILGLHATDVHTNSFSWCHKSLCNILNQTKQKNYIPIYQIIFLTAFWLNVVPYNVPLKEFHETLTQLNLEELLSNTGIETFSIPGQVPSKCRCTWSLHFDFCQQSLPDIKVSDTQCHRAVLIPPLFRTLSALSQKASSHPGTLGKAVRQECSVCAYPSGHQRQQTWGGNILTLNTISHCRTILQCSWDKLKCILFSLIWSWNLVTSATTHLNALTVRLWSSGIPLNLSQGRFSSHALDQAILWPLSGMDSFSSSSSWLLAQNGSYRRHPEPAGRWDGVMNEYIPSPVTDPAPHWLKLPFTWSSFEK